MLNFLCLAVAAPLLASAQQMQQPLTDHQHEIVVPLELHDGKTYTFESAFDGTRLLSSKTVAEVGSYYEINSHPQTALVKIPLDTSRVGSMILGTAESSNGRVEQDIEWIDTLIPGEHMPINFVGIRKGAMISKDVFSTRLALETPYISLPGEIYDILVQATNPTPHQHGDGYDDIVDCTTFDSYPDLVLGLDSENEVQEGDEDNEEREIVITPKQYVLKTAQDQCILLAQRAYQRGREEVVLGWAAVRGRDLVLDWVNERTGFGK